MIKYLWDILHYVLNWISIRAVRVLSAWTGLSGPDLPHLGSSLTGVSYHGLRRPFSVQHFALSPCLRYLIRMPVSSPVAAYAHPYLWSLLIRFWHVWISSFMKAHITELITTAKPCHLKLALWKDQNGLTIHEFSKTTWISLKMDIEDTFQLMWFRLKV